MSLRIPRASFRASVRRLLAALSVVAAIQAVPVLRAAAPYDFLPLKPASPNYARVFSGVKIGNVTPEPDTFKAGDEILSAAYAYLNPTSQFYLSAPYRDRLFVLLDHRLGGLANNTGLEDIGFAWQAAYAYMLFKHHRPADISAARQATYEQGLANNNAAILAGNPLVYSQTPGVLAQVWLNGDIRLAKAVYFGATALGDAVSAEKARVAIDGVMARCGLGDGGTRYVGFWNEVSSYHEETVQNYIYWWKITGSATIKAALDATVRYSVVSNEPSGFTEQSSNIPYKHMYNNRHSEPASLWKAYLYDDGYNFYFGHDQETTTSTRLLNAILYEPNRQTKVPSDNVGVFFDRNIQGPRLRTPTFGWIANGRDVQVGGPEELAYSSAQGYQGRMVGKGTFVGAFALGPIANKTSLKGALDTVCMEFKETAGTDTNYNRGARYRFLAQDEKTRVITRRNFATLSTTYRVSKRTSSDATANWNSGATVWTGNQLWVLTGERMIGLVQIANDVQTTVFGLDARLVFTGGRLGIMGSYLDLLQPDSSTFEFGQLRTRVHATNLAGPVTQQRIGISDPNSTDNFSALARIHDAAVNNDQPFTVAAGTRRWLVLDVTRDGVGYATSVVNVLPANTNWAVLQFNEGNRRVRVVQNLTATGRNYTGTFLHGTTYAQTSLHRSADNTVTPLVISSGASTVAAFVPPYEHVIAVNSNQPDDHVAASRFSEDVYP